MVEKKKSGSPCPYCNKVFENDRDLFNHLKQKHEGDEVGPPKHN